MFFCSIIGLFCHKIHELDIKKEVGHGMKAPCTGGTPSETSAAKLWNRARRHRSHRWTPILSLASTALKASPCFDKRGRICKQQIIHSILLNLKCLLRFQELVSLLLYGHLGNRSGTCSALIPASLLDRLVITGDVCSSASEEIAISALQMHVEMEKKQNAQHNNMKIISASLRLSYLRANCPCCRYKLFLSRLASTVSSRISASLQTSEESCSEAAHNKEDAPSNKAS